MVDSGVLLMDLLPITVGDFTLRCISMACPICNETIAEDKVLGDITYFGTDVVVVNAVGHCPKCLMLISMMRRVRSDDDGVRMEWPDEDGVWLVSVLSVPLLAKMKNWIMRLLWN